ncbi:hypothetical protein P9432_27215, partial [Escherichia coli]|uniref:hypothetical protein n=1 Tax=Escherichia coli TaxID=562 RepID=UPI003891D83A
IQNVYAKVVLLNDQDHSNDSSPQAELNVCLAGTGYIIVGSGNVMNERLPISFGSFNSLSESIYFPEEIGIEGMLTGT